MKRLLFFLMATLFAMQGFSQATLNEGFEGTTFPPDDWAKVTTQGTEAWVRYTSSSPRGLACASVNYEYGGHTNYLITPKLVVSSDQDSISFWIKYPTYYSGTTFSVLVSTTNNDVTSFSTTSLLTLADAAITTTWTKKTISLSNYIGDEIYIAFKVVDNNGTRVMLDDVTGPELFVPTCPKPTSLVVSNYKWS